MKVEMKVLMKVSIKVVMKVVMKVNGVYIFTRKNHTSYVVIN